MREGRLDGIITDGDLRRHMGDALLRAPVETVMSPQPKTIRPQALAAEALGQMNALAITSLFVLDGDAPARSASCIFTIACARAWHEGAPRRHDGQPHAGAAAQSVVGRPPLQPLRRADQAACCRRSRSGCCC